LGDCRRKCGGNEGGKTETRVDRGKFAHKRSQGVREGPNRKLVEGRREEIRRVGVLNGAGASTQKKQKEEENKVRKGVEHPTATKIMTAQ